MPKYPDSVLTKNKKGETEVRNLLSHGSFVKYNYIYPETGKVAERGKFSIILKDSETGKQEHYFMIPMKGNRFLGIPQKEKKSRKLWDDKRKKAVDV